MSKRHVVGWALLIAAVLGGAELLDRVRFPAPQMLLAMVVGIGLALAGRIPSRLPASISVGSQAMLGVLMGSYLQVSLLSRVGLAFVPVAAIAIGSLSISVLVAYAFARATRVALPTATLGLIAGGSAAVISSADELDADQRTVAFMQYLRVAFVALSAPIVAMLLKNGGDGLTAGQRTAEAVFPHWWLVGRGDQVAGLSIAVVLGIVGVWAGRRAGLPNPALLGPMLATAALTTAGVSHGFAPTNLFKEVLFVLIGFEVGTRFTKPVVLEMMRLVPAMLTAIVALCATIGVIGAGLVTVTELEFVDVYLATTPGGINAVLGAAQSMDANLPLITGVQSLRLFVMMLVLPFVVRLIGSRKTPKVVGAESVVRQPILAEK